MTFTVRHGFSMALIEIDGLPIHLVMTFTVRHGFSMALIEIDGLPIHLVMTNSSPWFLDGPNRNRWFTYSSGYD